MVVRCAFRPALHPAYMTLLLMREILHDFVYQRPRNMVVYDILGHAGCISSTVSPPTQTPGRIQKVDPPSWALILLWCSLQNPKVDLLFGSAQGSGKGLLTVATWELLRYTTSELPKHLTQVIVLKSYSSSCDCYFLDFLSR